MFNQYYILHNKNFFRFMESNLEATEYEILTKNLYNYIIIVLNIGFWPPRRHSIWSEGENEILSWNETQIECDLFNTLQFPPKCSTSSSCVWYVLRILLLIFFCVIKCLHGENFHSSAPLLLGLLLGFIMALFIMVYY